MERDTRDAPKSTDMTDAELDLLLSRASKPVLPPEAEARLMRRVASERPAPSGANVVPLRRERSSKFRINWFAGLPLAASLAFGVYLGSVGDVPDMLPASVHYVSSGEAANGSTSGIEDAEFFAEEDQS